MTAPSDTLRLMGHVLKAHGLHGAFKVWAETDDPQRFARLNVLYLGDAPATARPVAVQSVQYQQTRHGPVAVLKLEGIDTPEAAERLRHQSLFADEAALPPLADDEFYLDDLAGLAVQHEDGTPVGTIREVMDLPAHPVLVIAREGQPDALVPMVPDFLGDLDLDAGTVTIRPIDGMLDDQAAQA